MNCEISEEYMELQKKEIEKYRQRLTLERGRVVGREETLNLWVSEGRAKEFHNQFLIECAIQKNEN